ncbi:MAG: hypothetical protein ACI9VR_004163 [Cognaticolwellia sp.]|jgi:hypothetical protein
MHIEHPSRQQEHSMRTTSLIALITLLTACKGGPEDTGAQIDADQDGVFASEDCDDDNDAVFPGAEELCDGLDNDCDDEIDNSATDAASWYADGDSDSYGSATDSVQACEAPSGYIADSTDCDDANALINPDQLEICNAGVDDDCDGLADDEDENVDLSTGLSWWTDGDADGFGAGPASRACVIPSGAAGNEVDCDDGNAATFPGATEICDGLDNSCEGSVDEGLLGQASECPASTCLTLSESGETSSGVYWIDPAGSGSFPAYCDLVSDGGGWALISWTSDTGILTSAGYYQSEPYPGLDVCDTFDCTYGSGGTVDQMEALIQVSTEFGSGMSTAALTDYQALEDYDYASSFDYGDMSGITLSIDTSGSCDSDASIEGVNRVLAGPTDYDGLSIWLAPELRYYSYTHTTDTSYLWSYGLSSPCQGNGTMPAVYLGTWSSQNYGPYLGSTAGSRSSWVR